MHDRRTGASTSRARRLGGARRVARSASTAASTVSSTTPASRSAPALEEVSLADWDRVIAINLTGPLLGIQTVVPLMTDGRLDRQRQLGRRADGAFRRRVHHEQVGAARSLESCEPRARAARDQGEHDLPGLHRDADDRIRVARVSRSRTSARHRSGGPGSVDEVAPLVLYLISDESTYVSGTEIPIDGGLSSHGGTKSMSDAVRAAAPRA